MPDRANLLARQILERMKSVAASIDEDGAAGEAQARERRESQVIKLLATYAGITDGNTVNLVTGALPIVSARREIPERDRQEFAEFIRQHVKFDMS